MENSGVGTGIGLLRELLASSTQQRLIRELNAGSASPQRSVLAQPNVARQLADQERLRQQSAERASRRVFAEVYGRSALEEDEGRLYAAVSLSRTRAAQRHLSSEEEDAASACSISRDAAGDSDRSRQSPFSSARQGAGQESHGAGPAGCPAAAQAGAVSSAPLPPAGGGLPAALLQPRLPWALHTVTRPCLSLELLTLLQLAAIIRQSMPQAASLARSAAQLRGGNEPLLIYALFLLLQSGVLCERSRRHLLKSFAKRQRRNSRRGRADEHNRAFHEAFLAG